MNTTSIQTQFDWNDMMGGTKVDPTLLTECQFDESLWTNVRDISLGNIIERIFTHPRFPNLQKRFICNLETQQIHGPYYWTLDSTTL